MGSCDERREAGFPFSPFCFYDYSRFDINLQQGFYNVGEVLLAFLELG